MKIDRNKLQEYVDNHLISCRKHPNRELYIYNYTPICQYRRGWDDITRMCRGLILDEDGNVIARPFKKFHNIEEHQAEDMPDIPKETFEVYEKLDGSLGISYLVDDKPFLATRGSFDSEQAQYGSNMLQKNTKLVQAILGYPDYTFLLEIIYPQNRIVVDYGNAEKLVLLAVINRDSGEELDIRQFSDIVEIAKSYNFKNLGSIKNMKEDNREGYVVRFKSGLRVKLKFEEYVRLHRLLTQVSNKSIWELLKNDQPIEPLLDNIPDEYYQWLMKTMEELQTSYLSIVDKAMEKIKEVPQSVPRREQAIWIKEQENPHLLFSLLDGRPINEMVWKMVRPEYSKPFREDIDT